MRFALGTFRVDGRQFGSNPDYDRRDQYREVGKGLLIDIRRTFMDCAWITDQPEVIPVLGYCEYAGSLGLNPLASRLDHSGDAVTKMSRKSWKTTAILR